MGDFYASAWTFSSLAVILYFLYKFLTKNRDYWKKVGIPYVPAVPILGSVGPVFSKPMHDIEVDKYTKYGSVYGALDGRKPFLYIADLELVKSVLVKDFQFFTDHRDFSVGHHITDNMLLMLKGERWKRVRNLLTPTFTTGKIKKMTHLINESIKCLSEQFLPLTESGKPSDVKKSFSAFTMDVIARCAFSTKLDSHDDPNNQFVTMARSFFNTNLTWRLFLFIFLPEISKFFHISIFSPDALAFFEDVVLKIIKERKGTKAAHHDFLQLLLDAAEEANASKEVTDDFENDVKRESQRSLSQDEIVAQCVIFFIAGYETTSTTLSLASYLLAENQDCQEKLFAEIDATAEENEGTLAYDGIMSMKYLDQVVAEALRLFPPLIRLERTAVADYKLEGYNFKIPKGMVVGIPVYAMHRDPELFPQPEKFDPERFTSEAKDSRNPYAYLPFGSGPRICIGMRFATTELKLCLAHIIHKYRFTCPEKKVPLEFFKSQQVIQPKEVLLCVQRR